MMYGPWSKDGPHGRESDGGGLGILQECQVRLAGYAPTAAEN